MTDEKPKIVKTVGQANILVTLQDFSSIAKTGKLSNLFLESFAEIVAAKERLGQLGHNTDSNQILLNLDVLFAMLQQVKLNKSN